MDNAQRESSVCVYVYSMCGGDSYKQKNHLATVPECMCARVRGGPCVVGIYYRQTSGRTATLLQASPSQLRPHSTLDTPTLVSQSLTRLRVMDLLSH